MFIISLSLLNAMGRFAERVYTMTKRIPLGKVSTYGEIARALPTKGYRAVGQALHCNPHAPHVPCHRVIASDGSLGGFASGLPAKISLLRQEGVVIEKDRVDLQKFLYRLKKKGA